MMKRNFFRVLALLAVLWAFPLRAQDIAIYPQLGHSGGVYSVAYSPDGWRIVSGSGDNTLKLWDAETGREIRTLGGHSDSVISVAFSPDGRRLVSGSDDNTLKVWDTDTGREIRTLAGHSDDVSSAAFSPDGRRIVSGSDDETLKIWDAETGREIRTLAGHSGYVMSVAFSPDDRRIVSGSGDSTLKIWDAETGREIRTLSGHGSYVSSAAFSPDGRRIVSGSWDSTLKIWDAETGREIRTLAGHSSYVFSVAFSPDGRRIVSGLGGTIKVWDASDQGSATGREIRSLWEYGYSLAVESGAFSPDGRRIVSGSNDKTLKVWDTETGREIRTLTGHSSGITSAAYSPDGRRIVSGSGDKTLKLWDASDQGSETGREIRTLAGHGDWVNSAAFSPDGRRIVSGSHDKTLKIWDAETGREIRTLTGHSSGITSATFSPDGRRIVSGSWDNTLKVWDATTGREIRTLAGHSSGVTSVAYSTDGRRIISASNDRTVKVWDAETGREIRTLAGHSGTVYSAAYSPDGRRIVSGSDDNTLKIWDAEMGRELRTLLEHSGSVRAVAYSPDGRRIVSGSWDGTLRVWDAETGREIVSFIDFNDGEWICITPEGYYNASPKGDQYLNVRVGNNVYGIDQYRSTFYRPQVLEARLAGRPDPQMAETKIQDAAGFEPPVVVIRNPENGAALSAGRTELSVSVIDQRQPVKDIKITVNGRRVGGNELEGLTGIRGGSLTNTGILVSGNENRVDFRFPLSLSPGANRIEVTAANPYSEGRDTVEVIYRPPSGQDRNILPNLWILSIGINRYEDSRLQNLDYAVNDAREIINVFKAQEGKLYRQVNSLLIADGALQPTRENIIDNLGFLKGAGQRDVALLFIAGHGLNDDGGAYYFMPADAALNADGSIRPSKAISYREIQGLLDVPGQKLVFIDSCHSEGAGGRKTRGADNDQLVRALQDSSTVIFTASRGNEKSQESREYGHGFFTYSIIQGMRGAADLMKDGIVTMKELDAYVSETVPRLTNGAQHPVTNTPDGYVNFTVADIGD